MHAQPQIYPSSKFHEAGLPYPATKSQVDYLLRTRSRTGMPVIKRGRRVFIDVDQFLAWLSSNPEESGRA